MARKDFSVLLSKDSLEAFATNGVPMKEVARRVDACYHTVVRAARRHRVAFGHGNQHLPAQPVAQDLTPEQETQLMQALEAALSNVEEEDEIGDWQPVGAAANDALASIRARMSP